MRPLGPARANAPGRAVPAPDEGGAAPGPAAPSALADAFGRLAWRARRLWRRRGLRRAVTVQAPSLIFLAASVWLASEPSAHRFLGERAQALRDALTDRPRFAVTRIEIEGAGPRLEARLREALAGARGRSSLQLDAAELRARVEADGHVADARVALEAPDTLRVAITQRRPAAVWRVGGALRLLDAGGAVIGPVARRADRPELPLLAGAGAEAAAREGLAVLAAAAPVAERVRGLVRVGERRWDLMLTKGLRIMLPSERPVEAVEQAVALHRETRALDRDLVALDLRLPERPTLRLHPEADWPPREDAMRLAERDA